MFWRFVPLVSVLVFLLTGVALRVWLFRRRYGRWGVIVFRARNRSQLLRDLTAMTMVLGLLADVIGVALDIPWLRPWIASAELMLAGVVLLALATMGLAIAQTQMGKSFRIGIDENAAPGLVVIGVFRWSRNPIYCALFAVLASVVLMTPNPLSVAVAIAGVLVIRAQTLAEERYLVRTYGQQYRAYAARVGRFLPGIGLIPEDKS